MTELHDARPPRGDVTRRGGQRGAATSTSASSGAAAIALAPAAYLWFSQVWPVTVQVSVQTVVLGNDVVPFGVPTRVLVALLYDTPCSA